MNTVEHNIAKLNDKNNNELASQNKMPHIITMKQNKRITDHDIEVFLDTFLRYRSEENKAILKNFKTQELLSWAKILLSLEFQENFTSKSKIDELSDFQRQIFEELFISIPLNYIYWRDGVKYEQLFPTTDQDNNPICWAHAIASIIVLATRRIIGKEALRFEDVKDELIKKYGCKGNNVSQVLTEVLPKYGLHASKVTEDEVNLFNQHGSYLFYICGFYLTGEEWNDFSNFFDDPENKKQNKFLTSKDLGITKTNEIYRTEDGGHAVVCIDQNSSFFTYLNSWGNDWGNQGKFSMERGAISNAEYYSVYFYESELTDEEINCYEQRKEEAIKAFYNIIYNTNLSNFSSIQSDSISNILNNKSTAVINEVKKILINFCEDFWRPGKTTTFRNHKLSFVTTINEFNSMKLDEQISIVERIMDYFDYKTKKFFIKIRNLLLYIHKKYNVTLPFIEISSTKYEYLIDIKEEQEVKLSSHATNDFLFVILNEELIELMNKFDSFLIIIKYPQGFYKVLYDKLLFIDRKIRNNIKIGIFYENVDQTDQKFYGDKNISFIQLDTTVTNIIGRDIGDLRIGSFSFCTSLTQILIPSSVKFIGEYAFRGCTSLKHISLPSSIQRIGKYAFFECSSLEQIAIPPLVRTIEYWTFAGCSSLKKITIPSSIKIIEFFAFAGCSSLEQIFIPTSVKSILSCAFSGCSSLKQILIPASVKSIGCGTFEGCTSLSEVLILSSLTFIRDSVFKNCSSLTNISIPKSVISIDDNSFSGCKSLKEIIIPSSVKCIGSYAFNNCTCLQQISTNSSLTKIGKGAFSGCSSLKEIFIPSSVESIKMSSFKECSSLEQITFENGSCLKLIENYAFYKCRSLKQINIPFSVVSIESHAFYECTSLSQVSLDTHSQLKSIGIYAFYNCSSLNEIIFSNSLVSIGDNAFIKCSSLKKIKLNNQKAFTYNFKSMGMNVFDECSSLELLEIPSSISYFGKNIFNGCSSLKQLTIPLKCISTDFSQIDEKINIEINY